MRSRWLSVVAVVALVAAGCTTLLEASTSSGTPSGTNHAGWAVPQDAHGGPVISGDGRYSVFVSAHRDSSPGTEAFRRDNASRTTVRVSSDAAGHAIGGDAPAISRDGRFVLFRTNAALVAGDANLDASRGLTGTDWYVKDLTTGSFDLVSIDASGGQLQPGGTDRLSAIAFVDATGRYVAFQFEHYGGRTLDSDIYVRDRQAGVTHLVDGGFANLAGLSGDGLHVGVDDLPGCATICPGATPGAHIDDWSTGGTYHIGCNAFGETPMSDKGLFVAVAQQDSGPGCARGVARYNRLSAPSPEMFATIVAVTGPPKVFGHVTLSADGSRAAFDTEASLEPGDTSDLDDVYVSDLSILYIGVASRDAIGGPGRGDSFLPGLSADGNSVQFDSTAYNLVRDDHDGRSDAVVAPAVRPDDLSGAGFPVAAGGSTTVTLAGSGIAPNAGIFVTGDGLTVRSFVAGFGGAFVNVTVAPTATPGPRTITVVNPWRYGFASGSCAGCLVVTRAP